MKKEYLIFLIYSVLVFSIISINFYKQYNNNNEVANTIVEEESETVLALLLSLRQTYQEEFIKNHILFDEKTINLLPVRAFNEIALKFSKLLNNTTTIRTVSDRPRNPKNKANENESKIISYFKNNPDKDSYFKKTDNTYNFAAPLYIEKSCLKCHGKKEEVIPFIKNNYNSAYNYKIGELRGIVSINMTKQNIIQKLSANLNKRLSTEILLLPIVLLFGFISMKIIVNNKNKFANKLKERVNEKTEELIKLNNELIEKNKRAIALNEKLNQNIEELTTSYEYIDKQKKLIEQSENRFISLLNTFSDGLYISDADFNITYMNEPMKKQFGKNNIGNKCYNTIYNLDKRCDWCAYDKLKKNGEFDYEHVIGNQSKIVRNVLLDDQSKLIIFYDNTDRARMQQELKENEEKFRKITNSANDAVILVDNNEKIAMWNIAAQKIFGYTEEEILNKNLHEILPPLEYRDKAHNAFALFRKSGKGNVVNKTIEVKGLKKDGTIFPLELSLSAIKIKGKWSAVGVARDITVRKEYEKAFNESKYKIELAHKHITDNINYAKTIQDALLPTKEIISSYIKNHFLLLMPKDEVSGDFYYVNKFHDNIIFAAADSTGHGVSGGFLTMLGITYLHEIINNKETDKPSDILNELRKKFKNTFEAFESVNQNGLDIALCSLNVETNILKYAGAYNPLWIIRNNELLEFKATRNPIGAYYKEIPFTGHEIQLEKNDLIYIFSDGYVDQFGGKKNKKFMAKRFKELLLSISNLPLKEQKQKLTDTFYEWKGSEEQTDDIVVFAIRV